VRVPDRPDRLPAVVVDVDVVGVLPDLAAINTAGRRFEQAWLVVRVDSEPVGMCVVELPDEGLPAASVAVSINEQLRDEVAGRLQGMGLPPEVVPADLRSVGSGPFARARAQALRDAPPITAVVCTRDQPNGLRRCLASLIDQEHPGLKVLVVDNAPSSDASRQVTTESSLRGPVDYVVEPRAGLSHARNRALRQVQTELVAFLDDDETADVHWLAELTRGFSDAPRVDAVAGVVVPAELQTKAQEWFEEFGGHSKGRGFRPAVFGPGTLTVRDALFPLPPFGTGANMAFRRHALVEVGGFDTALGAGTPSQGAEDTRIFTQILLGGGTVVYRPSALTRHYHRRTLVELERQLHGYGVGLTAFYTSLLVERPALVWQLLRLAPRALHEVLGTGGLRSQTIGDDFPTELLARNRRGMLVGPVRYAQGRYRAHRAGPLR
jgi:glycosyltransferase involved in cell wall biosynthesis